MCSSDLESLAIGPGVRVRIVDWALGPATALAIRELALPFVLLMVALVVRSARAIWNALHGVGLESSLPAAARYNRSSQFFTGDVAERFKAAVLKDFASRQCR